MGWLKACQAGWQVEAFLKTEEAKINPIKGGVIFFQEFSGDWKKMTFCKPLQDGWCRWYEGHCSVNRLPVHLVRLDPTNSTWESYPSALRSS